MLGWSKERERRENWKWRHYRCILSDVSKLIGYKTRTSGRLNILFNGRPRPLPLININISHLLHLKGMLLIDVGLLLLLLAEDIWRRGPEDLLIRRRSRMSRSRSSWKRWRRLSLDLGFDHR